MSLRAIPSLSCINLKSQRLWWTSTEVRREYRTSGNEAGNCVRRAPAVAGRAGVQEVLPDQARRRGVRGTATIGPPSWRVDRSASLEAQPGGVLADVARGPGQPPTAHQGAVRRATPS